MFASSGDYSTWNVLTVILELPGLLLSHAGESDQCFQLLDYHLMVSQESAANSCEASTIGGLLLSFTFESGDF